MWGWRRYFPPRDVANSDGGKEAQGCKLMRLRQSMMGGEEEGEINLGCPLWALRNTLRSTDRAPTQ